MYFLWHGFFLFDTEDDCNASKQIFVVKTWLMVPKMFTWGIAFQGELMIPKQWGEGQVE